MELVTRVEGQLRLCQRYRKMRARGKNPNVVVTAIAREMVGFIWAIARHVSIEPREACAA
jgi:transposase